MQTTLLWDLVKYLMCKKGGASAALSNCAGAPLLLVHWFLRDFANDWMTQNTYCGDILTHRGLKNMTGILQIEGLNKKT